MLHVCAHLQTNERSEAIKKCRIKALEKEQKKDKIKAQQRAIISSFWSLLCVHMWDWRLQTREEGRGWQGQRLVLGKMLFYLW